MTRAYERGSGFGKRRILISLSQFERKLEGETTMSKPDYKWIAAGGEWSEP
jgi:hypothetical protein